MLVSLQVSGIRNLVRQTVRFDRSLTLLTGRNAQGKSSVLEAAYLLATTLSFRSSDLDEVIALEEPLGRVEGQWETATGRVLDLAVGFARKPGERLFSVGKSPVRLPDYLGLIPVLVLTGDGLRQLLGNPAERRRFIDRAVAAADPQHLKRLSRYQRALRQRNRLLQARADDRDFAAWEAILSTTGEEIVTQRRTEIERWQEHLGAWPGLFPEGETVRLRYVDARSKQGTAGETMSLGDALRQARPREIQAGLTTIGPHRDDLQIDFAEMNLLRQGSAGQVRSALSALILAQARVTCRQRRGERPLLILDDVDTDLDRERCASLLQHASHEAQVVAASSKPELPLADGAQVLTVTDGVVRERAA